MMKVETTKTLSSQSFTEDYSVFLCALRARGKKLISFTFLKQNQENHNEN